MLEMQKNIRNQSLKKTNVVQFKIYVMFHVVFEPPPKDQNFLKQHIPALSAQNLQSVECNKSQHWWAQHVAHIWPPCCNMLGIEI